MSPDQQADAVLDRAASPLLLLMLVAYVVAAGIALGSVLL